jgi:hypothetical protein
MITASYVCTPLASINDFGVFLSSSVALRCVALRDILDPPDIHPHSGDLYLNHSGKLLLFFLTKVNSSEARSVGSILPGSIRVLLSNPRWERRLLHFLELSGVGRVMENRVDEEETRAAKMDGWIIWDVKEGMARKPN